MKPIPTLREILYWAATALAGKNAELSDTRAKLAESEKKVQIAIDALLRVRKALDRLDFGG